MTQSVNIRKYTELDPRLELEQQVTMDLRASLEKRGAKVVHHGKAASHAPSSAPADITVDWTTKTKKIQLLVEVAQRTNESEFTSIVTHLNTAIAREPNKEYYLLYAGRSTSARMVRFLREENRNRADKAIPGRIIFLRLNDFQDILRHWRTFPKSEYPLDALLEVVARCDEFLDDIQALRVFQEKLFPNWQDKNAEIKKDIHDSSVVRQEKLRQQIVHLENKLRERGVTGNSAHKMLIYLFFLALFEDKRGTSRFTSEGFANYKKNIPTADRDNPKSEYYNYTAHHLLEKEVLADREIAASGMMAQYEKIELPDEFIQTVVLPIFEGYTFWNSIERGGVDIIGAVFEALARRAEKDNRIGQFFTPDSVVKAVCQIVDPRPLDLVLDPACGTARFLIHAMNLMLGKVSQVTDIEEAEVINLITQKKLLGVDIDPWVATIAKMNMYIHGDGKSNVRRGNGLSLSTVTPFAAEGLATLEQQIDCILTNPPLGDIDFQEVSKELTRSGLLGTNLSDQQRKEVAAQWSNKYLSIVPHVCVEEIDQAKYKDQVETWRRKEYDAERDKDDKAFNKAKKFRVLAEEKLAEVQRKIGAGELTYKSAGSITKGSLLFLSVIKDYLKDISAPSENEEWQGGKVGIIIDEAVLNGNEFAQARAFIVKNFFVKAIISLPRDTFEYLAKTTAKTSVLFLAKKPDAEVIQRQPVFYAKAESVGVSPTGKITANDLDRVVSDFNNWKAITRGAKALGNINMLDKTDGYRTRFWSYNLNTLKQGERLDFAFQRMKEEVGKISAEHHLCDILETKVLSPDDHPVYKFATVSRKDGRVRFKEESATSYKNTDLRLINEGDVILSGIDAVYGSIGVVGADCDQLVVSKEYYVLRIKKEAEDKILPEYVAALLRSEKMRTIIEGTITGTSNRTRISDIEELLELPMPKLPSVQDQQKIAETLRAAFSLQDEVLKKLSEVDQLIQSSVF